MAWTEFMDMSSGGGHKLPWRKIYIEASETDAKKFFEAIFDRDPDNVTCSCCGPDYLVSSAETLEEVSWYERNCDFAYRNSAGHEVKYLYHVPKDMRKDYKFVIFDRPMDSFRPYIPMDEFLESDDYKIIRASEIITEMELSLQGM